MWSASLVSVNSTPFISEVNNRPKTKSPRNVSPLYLCHFGCLIIICFIRTICFTLVICAIFDLKTQLSVYLLYQSRSGHTQRWENGSQSGQWLVTYRDRHYEFTIVSWTSRQYDLPTLTSIVCRQVELCRFTECPLATTAVISDRRECTRCAVARVWLATVRAYFNWSVSLWIVQAFQYVLTSICWFTP